MLAVRVVQEVERLGDDGIGEDEFAAVLQLPLDRRIAHGADAVRARQQDRAFHEILIP